MSRPARRVLASAVVLTALLVGCGKKGNPLPPLRPVPAWIADLGAHRVDDRIELRLTVPAANADGTTPAAIDRVQIFTAEALSDGPALTAVQIVGDQKNLRTEIRVRAAEDDRTPAVPVDTTPAPGERTTFVDRLGPLAAGRERFTRYYVAMGMTGGGRGRRGAASAVVAVPLADPPVAPAGISLTHDARLLTLSWQTSAGVSVSVFDAGTRTAPVTPRLLTEPPVTTASFTQPVEFGQERCFVVRSVRVTGPVSVEGPPSQPTCVLAIDRYAPPAPEDLQANQEGAVVTLNWARVEAPDLGGYVVLRGNATGENMQPLVRQPIASTTFTDAAVQAGVTYTYSVYAVDTAAVPNVSQQSNRQVVTVR